jgi:hypothetical protein
MLKSTSEHAVLGDVLASQGYILSYKNTFLNVLLKNPSLYNGCWFVFILPSQQWFFVLLYLR